MVGLRIRYGRNCSWSGLVFGDFLRVMVFCLIRFFWLGDIFFWCFWL